MFDFFPTLPTRDGEPAGKSIEGRMLQSVGGPSGIRTKILNTPEGEVMLRTRNGFPEFTLKKKIPEATTWRLWHGLYEDRENRLENIDTGDGYIRVMSNKGELTLRDWGDATDGTVMNAAIDATGSTYYSNFPLVSTAKLAHVPTTARYSISPFPGGPYTIDSETRVNALDKSDREVTVTKTNNVDFKKSERGGEAGVGRNWWPWLDPATGIVHWFSVAVRGNNTLQVFTFTLTRSDDEKNVEVGTYQLSYTVVFGAGRESWAERYVYDEMPQHSPSGAIALLQFYLPLEYASGDTRSNVTNNLLGAVVRVTLTSKTSAVVTSEANAFAVFPPMEVIVTEPPQGYTVGSVGTGKSVWPKQLNIYSATQWRVETYDSGTPPSLIKSVRHYRSQVSFSADIWDEWDRLPGWRDSSQETNFILGMFFPGTETPVSARVNSQIITRQAYINTYEQRGSSGMGSVEEEFTYTKTPYFNDYTIPWTLTTAGGTTQVHDSGSRTTVTRRTSVTVGATGITLTGDTTGSETFERSVREMSYTKKGYPHAPFPDHDPNNYYVTIVDQRIEASFATVSFASNNYTNDLSVKGRSLLWVDLLTNNVVRVRDWVYDDPSTTAATLLTTTGATAVPPGTMHASWNPKTGELATSDHHVQWV